jgi:formylglycine-generating enzyme required for sulfatase activity
MRAIRQMLFYVLIGTIVFGTAGAKAETARLVGTYTFGSVSPLALDLTSTATPGEWTAVWDIGTPHPGTVTAADLRNGPVSGGGYPGDGYLYLFTGTASAGVWTMQCWKDGAQPPIYYEATLTLESSPRSSDLTLDLGGGISMEFMLIPAGQFDMGSTSPAHNGNEQPVHHVTISKSFYMGKYLVTQQQYQKIMGSNQGSPVCTTNPINFASWIDGTDFSTALSAQCGRTVRLPTEAEWEYACRAGTTTAYCFGDNEFVGSTNVLDQYAWYSSNSGGNAHPVGLKKPNAWGLYDMHGNLWQWCWDGCDAYPSTNVVDPFNPTVHHRQQRGGAYDSGASDCRSTARVGELQPGNPSNRGNDLGFRVLVEVQGQSGAPSVSITSPANNATFIPGTNITINANASDSDGNVTKVQFYQGTTLLNEDTTSPYSYVWNNVAAGSYTLTAKAIDNSSLTTTSFAVSITVQIPVYPPSVSITSPTNNAIFTEGDTITINATASDSDGTVSKVQFFRGSTLLGEDTSSPYSYIWNSVAAGSYSLTAKAVDNSSLTTTSAAVGIAFRSTNTASGGNVGLNFGGHSMTASESAGAVVAFTNWNNLANAVGSSSSVFNSTGGLSGISVVWDGFEGTYSARSSAANGDEDMMWGYCDNQSAGATVTVSFITAPSYDVYVYFGSDTDARKGTVGINGANTYSYKTYSTGTHSFPASYTVTTDTGTNYPSANYAVWTNLTASSFAVIFTLTGGGINNGPHGMQIIMHAGAPPSTNTTPHGVPYSWLSIYGITSNQAQAETNDPDGDGMPTWKEYYAGTDPNVKGSVFRVLAVSTNRSFTWYGTTNSGVTNSFKVYRSTNLLSGSWQLVGSNITRSATGTNAWTDGSPPASPSIFYRPAVPASTQ